MDDEKLIENVRNHEFLYNLKHPKYMDNVKKEFAWKEIGHQLKQSAGDCKKRWQCLRDAYRRALNKKKGKPEQEAKNMKPWKYETEMMFVAPFIIERKNNKDAMGIISDDDLSDNGEENNPIEFSASENPYIDIEIKDITADASNANSTISDEDSQNEAQRTSTKPKSLKRKLDQSEPSVRTVLMAKLLEQLTNHEPPREHDDLQRFFLGIYDTVKKFPPYQQAVAKNKIFNLVSEMELEQLAPRGASSSTSTSASNCDWRRRSSKTDLADAVSTGRHSATRNFQSGSKL